MTVQFDAETQAALNALIGSGPQEEVSAESDVVVEEESVEGVEVDLTEVNPSGDDESVTPEEDAAPADANPAIEEIWVDDGKGRKKVQIDFSDKEKLKKYAEMAFGMRKFQLERDRIAEWKKQNEPKLQELQSAWDAIEKAHKSQGIKGLVNLLVGEDDAYDKHIENVLTQRQMRENASPEELARMEALEEAERIRRENEEIRNEMKKQQEQRQREAEAAATKELQDRLTPAYNKWSFDGKLGDAELEEQYNTALWQLSINKLKQIPEDQELTNATVNRVFQEVASRFNKVVTVKTKQKVAETLQKKKDAAQTKAATMAVKGSVPSATADEFKAHINSGNFVDSLKMFMSGKVKIK